MSRKRSELDCSYVNVETDNLLVHVDEYECTILKLKNIHVTVKHHWFNPWSHFQK